MNPTLGLDEAQRRAVHVAPETRQIVLAGPGSGKTHVVVWLVDHLVADGAYPDEILVISFSRAAVEVVRRRTGGLLDESGGVEIRTVDSLARRVLLGASDDDHTGLGFDETVRRAGDLLPQAGPEMFGDVRHVIIDEVQDLVAVRARFILNLLDVLVQGDAGFTVLGDPMQALYDFQLGNDAMTCTAFLDEVRARYHPVECVLTGEYRARSADSRVAALARIDLAALNTSAQLAHLDSLTSDISPLGSLDQDAASDIASWTGSTALLCDTNIRAALVAQQAWELGLPVEVTSGMLDRALPAWLAELLQYSHTSVVSRDQFLQFASHHEEESSLALWRVLMQASGGRRDLDLRNLATALQSGLAGQTLARAPSTIVTASTVHRSKGLEFDNVVLVDPDKWNRSGPDGAARTLFVALSRSRNRLTRIGGVDTQGWWKQPSRAGSSIWVRRPPRRGGRGWPTYVLMEPRMVRELGPTSEPVSHAIGTSVTWDRAPDLVTVDGEVLPSWHAMAGEGIVARTGERFGQTMASMFGSGATTMPGLRGGRVEGLETVVGAPRQDAPGRHGLWIGARIAGPVSFERNRDGDR